MSSWTSTGLVPEPHTLPTNADVDKESAFVQVVAAALGLPVDHPDVQTVYLAVYKNFMEAMDAIDNGE